MNHTVVQTAGRKVQRLPDVLGFDFGELTAQLVAVGVQRHNLQHTLDGQTHAANARLPVHDGGIDGDAIKAVHVHSFPATSILRARQGLRDLRAPLAFWWQEPGQGCILQPLGCKHLPNQCAPLRNLQHPSVETRFATQKPFTLPTNHLPDAALWPCAALARPLDGCRFSTCGGLMPFAPLKKRLQIKALLALRLRPARGCRSRVFDKPPSAW